MGLWLQSCNPSRTSTAVVLPSYTPQNGIYYWRTTFSPSLEERAFVREHHIGRIYLHIYDVDQVGYDGQAIEPIATLQFMDSLIGGVEYVPTVYITQAAIRALSGQEKEIAQKMVTRTLNMVDWHEIPNVQEIQIDGDWQASTQESYFRFCKELQSLLHEKGLRLSATIRISQLREKVPPVDRGVLMIYNTGSVRNVDTENSILSIETCKAYFSHRAIEKYALPLDYAFPTFGWAVVHSQDGQFRCLSYTTDYPEDLFEKKDSIHYQSLHYTEYKGINFYMGDAVRVETTSAEQILQVKSLLPLDTTASIILYHLDNHQIQRYRHEEINSVFAH